jgi:hypothetical protein
VAIFTRKNWSNKHLQFKMPLKQSYSSPSQTKFWTMIREAAATENLQTFLPTSFKTMNESSRCVFLSRAL